MKDVNKQDDQSGTVRVYFIVYILQHIFQFKVLSQNSQEKNLLLLQQQPHTPTPVQGRKSRLPGQQTWKTPNSATGSWTRLNNVQQCVTFVQPCPSFTNLLNVHHLKFLKRYELSLINAWVMEVDRELFRGCSQILSPSYQAFRELLEKVRGW